jgi:mono/diheme cytochrome c family protein
MSVTFEVAGFEWPQITPEETTRLLAFLYFIDYLGRPGDASSGERVFEDQGCVVCHDVGGGAADVGPDLGELQRFASPLFVAQEIWNHGPSMLSSMRELGMPAPAFDVGDLADLSAFVRREAQGGSQERLLFSPGNPNRGRTLFSEKGCNACHGDGARGGSGGPDLSELELRRSAESIAGTMWNHALEMRDSMRQRGVGWPIFAHNELADLVSFLYFLPFSDPPGDPERGARVFSERSCAACHEARGLSRDELAGNAPELTSAAASSSPAALVSAMWNHAPMMKKMILGEGLPWPELSGSDLRDIRGFLAKQVPAR